MRADHALTARHSTAFPAGCDARLWPACHGLRDCLLLPGPAALPSSPLPAAHPSLRPHPGLKLIPPGP